jgi:hypothetical protein
LRGARGIDAEDDIALCRVVACAQAGGVGRRFGMQDEKKQADKERVFIPPEICHHYRLNQDLRFGVVANSLFY